MKDLKDIFKPNPDIKKNAYLNWRFDKSDSDEEKFFELGSSYFEVASYLIEICIKDNINSKLDGWIFPILFNIYQGLELYLKCYNHLLNPEKKIINGGHNIKSISGEIYNKLVELKTNNNEIITMYEEYKIVRKFINMMYDNTSEDTTFVRYPINTNLEDFFYVGGKKKVNGNGEIYFDNFTIDIIKLAKWINYIQPILEKHIYIWDSLKNPDKY